MFRRPTRKRVCVNCFGGNEGPISGLRDLTVTSWEHSLGGGRKGRGREGREESRRGSRVSGRGLNTSSRVCTARDREKGGKHGRQGRRRLREG